MPLTRFKLTAIGNEGITNAKLADGAVDTEELADGAVTLGKTDSLFVNTEIAGTEAARMPVGTTAQRANAQSGDIRFNSSLSLMEYYDGTVWKGIDSPPVLTGIDPTTIPDSDSSFDIVLTGSNFSAGAVVKAIGTDSSEITATTTSVDSTTQITATFNGTSFDDTLEDYDIKVIASSSLSATLEDVLAVNASPAFTTTSGTVATINDNWDSTLTNDYSTIATIAATDDDGTSPTFALESGDSLAGMSIDSDTGVISGPPTEVSSEIGETKQFDIEATDGTNTVSRSFNIVVKHIPHLFGYDSRVNYIGIDDGNSTTNVVSSATRSNNIADVLNYTDTSDFAWHDSPYSVGSTARFQIDFTTSDENNGHVPYPNGVRINRIVNVGHTNNMGGYTFYGSDDASTWTNLGNGHFGGTNGGALANGGRITNYFDNNKAYKHYKMEWVNNDANLNRLYDGATRSSGWATYGILFQSTKYKQLTPTAMDRTGAHQYNGVFGTTNPSDGSGSKFIIPPYGVPENYNDIGWIPGTTSYDFDLGSEQRVDAVSLFSSFTGGSRGGNVIIYSSDSLGGSQTEIGPIRYETFASGGTGSDSTLTRPSETNNNYGGEYIYDITGLGTIVERTTRYIRLEFNAGYNVSGGHYPNTTSIRILQDVSVR